MAGVHTEASMSLDGYIAGPGDGGLDQLFRWYENGGVIHLHYRVRRP
ncbi:hypothetical protein ACGF7U_01615 [Micromonospora sp. NPDC047670]